MLLLASALRRFLWRSGNGSQEQFRPGFSAQCHLLGVAIISFLLLAVSTLAQTSYRDPGGAFTVEVPAGWRAEKQEQNEVTLSKGSATVRFDVAPSEDGSTPPPKAVLDGIEKQIMQECPQAEVLRRGETSLAGQSGLLLQVACNDPQHGTAIMSVAVATENGQILVCNSSSLSKEYSSVKPLFENIVRSFHLGSGGTGMAAAGQSSRNSPRQPGSASGPDAQKLRALEDACANGVLTPDECAAKRAAFAKTGNSSDSSAGNPKLQALERACKAGVFSPEECAAKQAALANGTLNSPTGGEEPASAPQPNVQSAMPVQGSPDSRGQEYRGGGAGDSVYNDPQGAFSLKIVQGWTAETKGGCYGPSRSCPPNSSGVNIYKGKSWAFVAPYSGKAKQPTDVVSGVAGQYQTEYQNFKVLQNEASNYNGLDVGLGLFSAMDSDGVTVSLVAVGVAAPNGRYYVLSSSVAQSEAETAGAEITKMLGSIRFAGQ